MEEDLRAAPRLKKETAILIVKTNHNMFTDSLSSFPFANSGVILGVGATEMSGFSFGFSLGL